MDHTALVVAVIVVLILLAVWVFSPWSAEELEVSNCSLYGDPKPIGMPGGPTCKGTTFYGGLCYGNCPINYQRISPNRCRSSSGKIVVLTGTAPKWCPSGRQYYNRTCVKSCPADYERIGACACRTRTVTVMPVPVVPAPPPAPAPMNVGNYGDMLGEA